MAYSRGDKFSSYGPVFQRSIESFEHLTDPNALAVQPMRLRLESAPRAMTLKQFNTQYPSSVSLQEVALINGIGTSDQLRSGQTMKRVTGGSPGSPSELGHNPVQGSIPLAWRSR